MRIRKVLARDFMHEADNADPTKYWTGVDGDWDIVTRKLKAAHDGAATIGTAYFTNEVTQQKRLKYDLGMRVVTTSGGWWAALIIQADAQAGRYLGNSVVIYIDATDIKLYTSAANVLTERATATLAHIAGGIYRYEVDFNTTTGAVTVYEDTALADARPEATTSVLTGACPGAPYSGNTNIGLACEDCEVDFDFFQVHRPDYEWIIDGSVRWGHYLNKRPSHFRFETAADDDNTVTYQEFTESAYIEILTEDGTLQYRELYGRVEQIDIDTARGTRQISGRDILQQLVVQEADYTTGGAVAQGTHITGLIGDCSDDLPTIDVKAGGDNYEVDYEGRSAYDSTMSVCQQMGYSLWSTAEGKVKATDTYAASGITIDNDDDVVLDASVVRDVYDLVNTITVYYDGGDEVRTDVDSQNAHGKRGGPVPGGALVDYHIAAAGAAQDLGDGIKDFYKDVVLSIRVCVADYHELNVGETVTLELDNLGITGQSALVEEKHFDDRYPWFTFFCTVYSVNPVPRSLRDPSMSMDAAKHIAQGASAWHL